MTGICWHTQIIDAAGGAAESREKTVSYKMQVKLAKEDSTLNVRNAPSEKADRIGRIGHGAIVTVQAEFENGWKYITYGDGSIGYVDGRYLAPYEEPEVEGGDEAEPLVTIVDSAGHSFRPIGDFKVYFGSID